MKKFTIRMKVIGAFKVCTVPAVFLLYISQNPKCKYQISPSTDTEREDIITPDHVLIQFETEDYKDGFIKFLENF